MGFETPELSGGGGVVVDNSVTMRWVVDDGSRADRRYASAVLNTIRQDGLLPLVPYLWVSEAAFVIAYYSSREEIRPEDAESHLSALFGLCAVVPTLNTPLQLYREAIDQGISAYDVSYLLLAEEYSLPLATLDRKMKKVARRKGIELL